MNKNRCIKIASLSYEYTIVDIHEKKEKKKKKQEEEN